MTYGEANRDVRAAVVELFGYRRITYYLGASGNGRAPAWGSPEQARAAADLIQRYRALVWKYAHRVVQAACPPGATPIAWGLPLRLAARIQENAPRTEVLPGGRVANVQELATPQPVELIEAWRRAAAAAVVGLDRELGTLDSGLERSHRLLLAKDGAELTLALVHLDDRYRWAPGWRFLGDRRQRAELGRPRRGGHKHQARGIVSTALATADWASQQITQDSYVVDQLGWQPRPMLIDSASPDLTDLGIDALHNTAVHLGCEFPRALGLRGLSRLSRLTSLQAARLAEAAGSARAKQAFDARARTYAALNSILRRSIDGNLGRGDHALAEATIALSHLASAKKATPNQIREVLGAFHQIDEAIGTRLQQGARDHRYLVANGRHLAADADRGVYRSVPSYEELIGPSRSEVLTLARVLQRVPDKPHMDLGLVHARSQLAALLAPVAETSRASPIAKERSLSTQAVSPPSGPAPALADGPA